ncbi:MAG: STAS domain-containing protein [Candidatus Neomarinimicrobiota bacterium]
MEITDNGNGIQTVYVDSKFDTVTAPAVEKAMLALVNDGVRKMICNLEHCEYISSMALRAVLNVAKLLQKNGGQFVLCNLSAYILEIFELAGFTRILTIVDKQQTAVEKLNAC